MASVHSGPARANLFTAARDSLRVDGHNGHAILPTRSKTVAKNSIFKTGNRSQTSNTLRASNLWPIQHIELSNEPFTTGDLGPTKDITPDSLGP